jgi:hypothetical protein
LTPPLHGKYSDIFLMDDVSEDERKAAALDVADEIIETLKDGEPERPSVERSGRRWRSCRPSYVDPPRALPRTMAESCAFP